MCPVWPGIPTMPNHPHPALDQVLTETAAAQAG